MWLKKLKRKKFQFGVIGIILIFATAILTTCISMSFELDKYIANYYSKDKNADYYITATKGSYDVIKKDYENADKIDGYHLDKNTLIYQNTSIKKFNEHVYSMVLNNYKDVNYTITPVEGDLKSKGPKEGEIWIEQVIATAHNIKVGDTYTLNNKNKDKFKITTIINQSIKPSSMDGGQIIYINQKDYDKFKGNQKIDYITVDSDLSNQDFIDYISNTLVDDNQALFINPLTEIINTAKLVNTLVISIGIIAAIFMLIVTIVIIRFFIRSTIMSEYSAIGTYKSVGFNTKEIISFYLKCYLFVGSISVIVGSLIGIPSSKLIGSKALENLGEYSISSTTLLISVLVMIVTFLLLYINVKLSLRRIKKITPVDALRIGTTSSKAKIKKSLIKHAHSSLSVAINELFKNKSRSLLMILVITVSFYISMVFLNICYSIETIDVKASSWVACPTAHGFITNNSGNRVIDNKVINYVKNNKYVKTYTYGTLELPIDIECDDKDVNLKYASKMCFNTYDKEHYNINYSEGRPPKSKNEIALSNAILDNSKYKVGDYIELKVDGSYDTFLITAAFDLVGDQSGLQMMNSYFKGKEEIYKTGIAVCLKDKNDFDNFKKDLENKFENYKFKDVNDYIGDVRKSIQSILIPVTIIIIVIFLVFTLLNIINLIIMNNKDNRKNNGILKAYGFTNSYILRKEIAKISILSILGLSLATLLNKLFTRSLFWMGLGCDGYNVSLKYTSCLLIGGFALILIVTRIVNNSIKSISPKELMEE